MARIYQEHLGWKTSQFTFSFFKNGAHDDHFLIGWLNMPPMKKILGFISLVHHLSHLNHLNTQPILSHEAHGFNFDFRPNIIS